MNDDTCHAHAEFSVSEFFFLKARPATEGDRRFLYIEPSTEDRDGQKEVIEQDALAKSSDHFLKFGNIDLEHKTLIGTRLGLTPEESRLYEIGHPVDVKTTPHILVKAELYRGEGETAKWANFVWKSQTEQMPPRRLYPSVGGRYLDRRCGPKGCVVKAVVWNNIGLAPEPVNTAVKAVSIVPFDEFFKAVVAGYSTDSTAMTGGRATTLQSIQGGVIQQTQGGNKRKNYAALAHKFLKTVGAGSCSHTTEKPTLASLVAHFRDCEGVGEPQAKAYAAHLIHDIARHVRNRPSSAAAAA